MDTVKDCSKSGHSRMTEQRSGSIMNPSSRGFGKKAKNRMHSRKDLTSGANQGFSSEDLPPSSQITVPTIRSGLMRFMRKPLGLCLISILGLLCISGCETLGLSEKEEPMAEIPAGAKFTRFFVWGAIRSEEDAKRYKEMGVTDITVNMRDRKAVEFAKKYGLKIFAGVGPGGNHPQRISEREQAYQRALFQRVNRSASMEERKRLAEAGVEHRKELQYQYGAEPVTDLPEVFLEEISCFNSPESLEKSKKSLKALCENEEVQGIVFDYVGYVNYRGCYCDECLNQYDIYRKQNRLPDTQVTKDEFYRKGLTDYYNGMIDYIKSLRPEIEVAAHLYPVFLPEPLYGNRLKLDLCGQTVAWYLPWTKEKIAVYTKIVSEKEKKYYPNATGIPFLGFSANNPNFPEKTPQRLELELREILAAGGRSIMLCSGDQLLQCPDHVKVIKKYVAGAK